MRSTLRVADAELFIGRWRRQVADRSNLPHRRMQRLAALSYLANGPVRQGLIAIKDLLLVVLHAATPRRELVVAGFSAESVEWGVAWGGPTRNPFLKDLALEPAVGARGRRLDLSRLRLVELALQLERDLRRAGISRRWPVRRRIILPRLWAGLRRSDASNVQGDGPELAEACRQTGKAPQDLLREAGRNYQGLTLLPLDWVSHRWQQFVEVFAEIGRFPRRQVCRLRDADHDLSGYRGASEFNFSESRFQRRPQPRQLACA